MVMAALGNINAREEWRLQAPLVGDGEGREGGIKIHSPLHRVRVGRFYEHSESGEQKGAHSALSLNRFHSLLLGAEDIGGIIDGVHTPKIEVTEEAYIKSKGEGLTDDETRPLLIGAKAGNRISRDVVAAYEKFVDLEYVPFTIQDLRTNEIISMPAFITAVGDSFSADYSDSQGYGRTDPVKSYSKTTRSIDLSFVLCAMNDKDFEYMWWVINRLTAMLYPQRSSGRIRTYNDNTKRFTQPFSQVPTASPVVRLRLGELFHTNYHVKRLAHLFGDGTPGLDLKVEGDADMAAVNKQLAAVRATSDSDIRAAIASEAMKGFKGGKATAGDQVIIKAGASVLLLGPKEQDSSKNVASGNRSRKGKKKTITKDVIFTVEKLKTQDVAAKKAVKAEDQKEVKMTRVVYRGLIKSAGDAPDSVKPGTIIQGAAYYLDNKPGNFARVDMTVSTVGAKLTHDPKSPQFDDQVKKQLDKKYGAEFAASLVTTDEKVDFFASGKNAIVRSFGVAMGRGLAGVITQMSFDYEGANWGVEATKRNRAPMKTTVTLSFSPIHDLPLGLSAQGKMIAPSHPVGPFNLDPHEAYVADKPADTIQAQARGEQIRQGSPLTEMEQAKADAQKAKADAEAAPKTP